LGDRVKNNLISIQNKHNFSKIGGQSNILYQHLKKNEKINKSVFEKDTDEKDLD